MKKLSKLTFAFMVAFAIVGHVAGVFAWQESTEKKAEKGGEAASEDVSAIPSTTSDPNAVDLLDQAKTRLFERRSVQADVVQTVSLGEYRVRSSGKYVSATGFRHRLQYQLSLGDLTGEFLEVCDGQILHTRRQITPVNNKFDAVAQPETEMTRRDIQRIRREALGIKDGNPTADLSDALRAAEAGLGGLPAILAMIERTMILEPVRTQTVGDRDYFVLQGRMRPDRQKELLTGLGSAGGQQVAGFLPDLVRVYLEQETLFPEKFVYLKKVSGKKEEGAARPLVPLITIEYDNVILDQPLQESQFIYMAPPGLEERDETAMYIEMMRQAANAVLTQPEAEGAGKEKAE
ncbi:MAG TPA: hypothetical protein VNQ76_22520 [Planctomicrobium sp.]|nr:hypothetical protein [Planctomicrobium sp.]